MRIRHAVAEDLDELARLRVELWPDGSFEEHRREAELTVMGKPPSTLPLVIFVAEEQSRIIGFVEVGLRSHAEDCDASRPVGFIEGWFVVADERGRGVGRALIARAEAWSREQGCTELGSNTWLDNAVSQRAHEALGFREVERTVHYKKALEH